MLFQKQGFPEEGELVMCTVTNVQYHSVFAQIEDYGRTGLIHISEVSPGRIRNIRDFVKEGKKIVCKVLKINKERGHIDLSLRRVNDAEKRRKIEEIKREQQAVKIIEFVAKKVGTKTESLYKQITDSLSNYGTVYEFFEDVVRDEKNLAQCKIDAKALKSLGEVIKQRIKPPQVEIKGKMKISTYATNGVDIVKESLKKAQAAGKVDIHYLGSGMYHMQVKAPDYKEAEKTMKKVTETAMKYVEKHEGVAEFSRED